MKITLTYKYRSTGQIPTNGAKSIRIDGILNTKAISFTSKGNFASPIEESFVLRQDDLPAYYDLRGGVSHVSFAIKNPQPKYKVELDIYFE